MLVCFTVLVACQCVIRVLMQERRLFLNSSWCSDAGGFELTHRGARCDSGCVSTISCWLLEITVILDDCRPSKAASAAAFHLFFQTGNTLKNPKYCIST